MHIIDNKYKQLYSIRMNEFEPLLELEPDQRALKMAWKELAEAVVLYAGSYQPLQGHLPVTPGGAVPYEFSYPLCGDFIHDHLSDDESHTITAGEVVYATPHKFNNEEDEPMDFVDIRWSARMPNSDIGINHSLSIIRMVSEDYMPDLFIGDVTSEYVEILSNGTERTISRTGLNTYPFDEVTFDNVEQMIQDGVECHHLFTFDDLEAIQKVTEFIRSQNG